MTTLEKEGLVRLHYHPQVMGEHTDIAIHYWDASAKTWQPLGGAPSEVDNAYAVAADRLGIYALMGVPVEFPYGVYLPLIVK